jgi:hypothetical protein
MCLWGLHAFLRCDVLDSTEQKNLFGWGAQFKKSESGTLLIVWQAMHHKQKWLTIAKNKIPNRSYT